MTKSIKPDYLLSSHEAGTLMQMDPSSIVKWVNEGLLPAYRTPGGHRRIRAGDLLAFLRAHDMFVPDELRGGVVHALVVDDDVAALQALTRGMKSHRDHVELTTSTSAIEALVRVGAQRPDALVLDAHLRGMDPLDVVRQLKSLIGKDGLTVVLVSSKPNAELERKARALGVSAVLTKPLTAAKLVEVLSPTGKP